MYNSRRSFPYARRYGVPKTSNLPQVPNVSFGGQHYKVPAQPLVLPPDGRLPAINNTGTNNPRKVYARCPMCKGKGFYEQVINPMGFNEVPSLNQRNGNGYCVNAHLKPETQIRRNTISDTGEPLKLPVLVREPRKSLPKVHVSGYLVPPENGNTMDTLNTRHSENTKNTINGRHSVNRPTPVFGNLVLPKVEAPRSISSLNSEHNNKSPPSERQSANSKKNLLPEPTEIENPHETMKIAINNLKQSQWQIVLQAVHDIVQVSRYNPGLVDPHMPVINRTLCHLLQSLRSQVTRTACQAMRELFRNMQCTQRPEFDEVVSALLQRTADMNRFIRQDSNEALDSMAMYIPPYQSVRALVDKGASHKNPLVRTATARLLTCVIMISGADAILSPTANKDTRSQVLLTAAKLLGDGNLETRIFAKKLVRFLMDHEDFETVFYNVVDRSAISKIEKTLNSLRSQVRESAR